MWIEVAYSYLKHTSNDVPDQVINHLEKFHWDTNNKNLGYYVFVPFTNFLTAKIEKKTRYADVYPLVSSELTFCWNFFMPKATDSTKGKICTTNLG